MLIYCQIELSITAIYYIKNCIFSYILCFLVYKKIFYNFCENFAKSIENVAKINDFTFAKFREIQNNFVKISCFANFSNAVSQPPYRQYRF